MELSREDQRELNNATNDIKYLKEDVALLQKQVAVLMAFRWYIFGIAASVAVVVNLIFKLK